MAKEVYFNQDAKEKLKKGFKIVGDAAGSTLGAGGKNVIISPGYGHMPISTKDGVTVVKSIFLRDEVENTGVMLIRGASEKTLEMCGDGTTTSVVLAQNILENGMEEIAKGCNVQEVKSGVEKAVKVVVDNLKRMSVPVTTNEMIKSVATISANNDTEIGELIANAYDKIGLNGLLTIEDSKTIDSYVVVTDGAEMPRGYVSDKFVTHPEKMQVIYENPMILVLDYEVKMLKELEPIMNEIAQTAQGFSRPWIIVARGFDGEVHNTMVVNKLKNGVKICLVCAPSAYQKEALQDIAALTGATLICDENGVKVEHATIEDMGTCDKIVVSKFSTMILGGDTDKDALDQIKKEITLQMSETGNAQLKDILEKRLARLTGSIGVLYVGGATDLETKERKDRVDDAVRAVKSAIEEGVVVGGGVALVRCMSKLQDIIVDGDEAIGVNLVFKACFAPISKMLGNAGASMTLGDIENDNSNYGYNIKTKKFGDLFEEGIIDPVKVVRCALQNAASVASQVLTSDVLMVEVKPD